MNNFVQRAVSGAVFVAILVGSILWHPYAFGCVFTIVTALAIHEFHKLTNRPDNEINVNKASAIVAGILLFVCSYLYASNLLPATVFFAYALFVICCFVAELYRKQIQPIHNWAYFLLGQVMVALPFSLLNFILFMPAYQPLILLAVFVTIWVNDTGAYLTGMTFGRHKLFERVSPKKSWEGFIGGALFALLSGYIFSRFIPEMSLIEWLVFSEIIVVCGTFGDLNESLLKRTLQVKDSGNAIPGHGGLLDRFDSMMLAVPATFIYLTLILF